MIVVAGLSPAWQQILVFDRFQPGQVNRAEQAYWCGSGKVLNVGMALAHVGATSRTISPLGGPARALIEAEFAAAHVSLHTIVCGAPTRVCTTILDRATSTTTELVENAPPLTDEELKQFIATTTAQAAAANVVVLTGSLPAGSPPTLFHDLLKKNSASAILDVRGAELRAALPCRPLIVKPNREELAATVGHPLADDRALVAAMREVNNAGAQWVVVTSGKQAVWVTSATETYRLVPPTVGVVTNPIGCGDALTAGLAAAIDRGASVLDAVRNGMAAAADRLRLVLPSRLNPARVATIAESIAVETA